MSLTIVLYSLAVVFNIAHGHGDNIETTQSRAVSDAYDYTPTVNSALIAHGIAMSFIVLIGIPCGYGLIISKNYFYHKLVQSINITIMIIFGSIATFGFSSGSTVHANIGRFILLTALFQLILPHLKYINSKYELSNNWLLHNAHAYTGLILMVFLLPFQWTSGILHVESGLDYFEDNYNSGHIIPGLGFYLLGVASIWNSNSGEIGANKLRKYERIALSIFAPIELIGELATHHPEPWISLNETGFHHMTLDIAYISTALLLWIFNFIKFDNYEKWHDYLMGAVVVIYGWTLMHHHPADSGREPIQGIHELGGQIAIICGIFRATTKLMFAGIFSTIHGITFIWSNPSATGSWVIGMKYPGMSYVAFVLLLGVLVSAIHGVLHGIYYKYNNANNINDTVMKLNNEINMSKQIDNNNSNVLVERGSGNSKINNNINSVEIVGLMSEPNSDHTDGD